MTSAEMMETVRNRRRAAHLNVLWLRDDGQWDEWSFVSVKRRDIFIANLTTEWHIL